MKKRNKKISMATLAVVMGVSQSIMFADLTPVKAAEETPVNVLSNTVATETALPTYEEAFGIPQSAITAIKNNAGSYNSTTAINKAIDGNAGTHWETNKPNSASFNNIITVTFDDVYEIAKLRFTARQSAGNKGFPFEYKLYYSTTETGDDFQPLTEGSFASSTGKAVDIDFAPTNVRRVQFEFVKAKENWAAVGELNFYHYDSLTAEFDKVFTDNTYSELSSAYSSTVKIQELLDLAQTHPNRAAYEVALQDALTLAQNPGAFDNRTITLSQRGDVYKEAKRTKINTRLNATDVTGYYAVPGETLYIYVDADEKGILPKLFLGQTEEKTSWWQKFYSLKVGMNVFKVPTDQGLSPAAIYLANEALPSDQAYAPKVRVSGGTKYPMYVHGKTDMNAFKAELDAYMQNVSFKVGDFNNGNPNNHNYNLAEFVSENNIITTSAAGAQKTMEYIVNNNRTVDEYLDAWETLYDEYSIYSGFDMEDETSENYRLRGVFMTRVFSAGPYGFGGYGFTGYLGGGGERKDGGFYATILRNVIEGDVWAIYHEWGHVIENGSIEWSECTNNLYSTHMQYVFGKNLGGWGVTFNYNQVEAIFGHDIYGKASKYARQNPDGILNGLDHKQKMLVAMSYATGYDLTEHFVKTNLVTMNEATEEKLLSLNLKPLDKKLWYGDYSMFKADAIAFEDSTVKPTITATGSNPITLNVNIDQPKNSVLVYEVYRDGEVIGTTKTNTYVDETAEANTVYAYSVVAYDKKLNPSPMSDSTAKNSSEPSIVVNGSQLIELRSDFNPLDLVKGFSATNEDITSNIQVVSNTVDTGRAGTYEVSYTLADSVGNTTAKTVQIEVVSEFQYVSDAQEYSKNLSYGSLKKDKNMQNAKISLTNGTEEIVYDKGLTAHATSEVVYSVANQGYSYFESFVGIDKHARNSQANAKFEVWVDGVKQFDSGAMKGTTAQKYVKVSLAGANELKLVTDSLGSNSYDHTAWGGARFAKSSSVPTIEATGKMFEVGEVVDLQALVSANDVEDGVLTPVVTTDYVAGSFGSFNVTFTATDSDGNSVSKTVQIYVPKECVYATDVDWASATVGWGSVRKDSNVEGNMIQLQTAQGVQSFAKGIGAHATSTIVYDLTNMNVDFFQTYGGVDYSKLGTGASVNFQVYVDGNLVEQSGVLGAGNHAKQFMIDLRGASELKLVADASGANSFDHAVWADAKFLVVGEAVSPEPELTPEQVAAEQIGIIKTAVEAAVATVDITQIDQVYYMKPAFPGYVSNETDTAIVAALEAALAEMPGEILVDLSNTAQENGQRITGVYQDIPSLLENRLMIMYRADAESPYYMYINGQVNPYVPY